MDALNIFQDDYERRPTYSNLMGILSTEAVLMLCSNTKGNADMGSVGIRHSREV